MIKNHRFLYLLLLLLPVISSCSGGGYGGLRFSSYQMEDTAHLFHRSDYPFCRYTLDLEVADKAAEEGLKEYVNTVLLEEMFPALDRKTLPEVDATAQAAWNAYRQNYLDELEDIIQEAVDEGEPIEDNLAQWMGYYRQISSRVAYKRNEHLCLEVRAADYTGGAHEYAYAQMLNLDLKNRQVLHLEDLFAGDFREALTDYILERLLKDYKAEDLEDLEDKGIGVLGPIEPVENFILTDRTITFVYNPYDIASWGDGRIDVVLELSDLKDILR